MRIAALIYATLLIAPSAYAATTLVGQCFDIVFEQGAFPILLNRCNGRTWMLVRHPLAHGNAATGDFGFSWDPLQFSDRPAMLGERQLKEFALPKLQVTPVAPPEH
jgi:hypothetical protein